MGEERANTYMRNTKMNAQITLKDIALAESCGISLSRDL